MGQEAESTLVRGKSRAKGRAHLESDHLLFRGDAVREKVMFATVREARADGDTLHLVHAAGALQLLLPAKTAAKWVAKILNPPTRLDKLGVKSGMRVAIVGVDDADLTREINDRGATIVRESLGSIDVLFYSAESAGALDRLAALRACLTPAGALWVVHRKGKEATLKDVEVFAAAKRVGLVDTKVASFSATHTAEKLVIPLALRGAPAPTGTKPVGRAATTTKSAAKVTGTPNKAGAKRKSTHKRSASAKPR